MAIYLMLREFILYGAPWACACMVAVLIGALLRDKVGRKAISIFSKASVLLVIPFVIAMTSGNYVFAAAIFGMFTGAIVMHPSKYDT